MHTISPIDVHLPPCTTVDITQHMLGVEVDRITRSVTERG